MSNIWLPGRISTVCPYYDHESEKSITCEGVAPKTVVQQKFETKEKKEEWQQEVCNKYPNCCFISMTQDFIFKG